MNARTRKPPATYCLFLHRWPRLLAFARATAGSIFALSANNAPLSKRLRSHAGPAKCVPCHKITVHAATATPGDALAHDGRGCVVRGFRQRQRTKHVRNQPVIVHSISSQTHLSAAQRKDDNHGLQASRQKWYCLCDELHAVTQLIEMPLPAALCRVWTAPPSRVSNRCRMGHA